MIRLLVLALVLCLMVPMIVACQDNTQKPVGNNNNNNNNNNNGSSVFDIYNVEDGLPESANYDDIFTILYYNATGVPESNILFNCTHTHSGVDINSGRWDGVGAYREMFSSKALCLTQLLIPRSASVLPSRQSLRVPAMSSSISIRSELKSVAVRPTGTSPAYTTYRVQTCRLTVAWPI